MNIDLRRDNCCSTDIGFYTQRAAQLRREAILEFAHTVRELVLAPIPAWFRWRVRVTLDAW